MAKKVLAILGGPRKDGKAAQMLDIAIEAAQNKGFIVKKVELYEKNIAFCKGCMACRKSGVCPIKDDAAEIAADIKESDLIIVSSPTYFANVPAVLKNLFDRTVPVFMCDNDSPIPKPMLSSKQKYLLMTTCTTPFPFDRFTSQSTGCIRAMEEVMKVSGMKCAGKIIFAGTRGKTEVPASVKKRIISKISAV